MKTTMVTIADIKVNNPRFCLSANRVLRQCHKCVSYLTCKSKVVNWKFESLFKQKQRLTDEYRQKLNEINQKMEEL